MRPGGAVVTAETRAAIERLIVEVRAIPEPGRPARIAEAWQRVEQAIDAECRADLDAARGALRSATRGEAALAVERDRMRTALTALCDRYVADAGEPKPGSKGARVLAEARALIGGAP